MKPENILTTRLKLRRALEQDAENLFNYTKDLECSRFLTRQPHTHIEQTKNFLEKWCKIAWDNDSVNFSWVVSLASNDEAIGLFIASIDGHMAQVHFGIRKEFWRQGYTSEMIQAGADWLLSVAKLQRVWTVCDLENIGSFKALEKSGFKQEGLLRKWIVLPYFGEVARDCYIYSRVEQDKF